MSEDLTLAQLVYVGDFEAATDDSLAAVLSRLDSASRQKVIDIIEPVLAQYPDVTGAAVAAVAAALTAELARIPVVRNDPQPSSERGVWFNTPDGVRTWLGFSHLIDPETGRVRPPRETADDLRRVGSYVHDDGAGTGIRAANGARLWIDWEALVDPLLKVVPPTLLAKVAAGGVIFAPNDPSPLIPAGAYFTWFDTTERTFKIMMGDAA